MIRLPHREGPFVVTRGQDCVARACLGALGSRAPSLAVPPSRPLRAVEVESSTDSLLGGGLGVGRCGRLSWKASATKSVTSSNAFAPATSAKPSAKRLPSLHSRRLSLSCGAGACGSDAARLSPLLVLTSHQSLPSAGWPEFWSLAATSFFAVLSFGTCGPLRRHTCCPLGPSRGTGSTGSSGGDHIDS